MKSSRMKCLKYICTIIIALILLTFLILGINKKKNGTVVLTQYAFAHEEIPSAFDGYKIMFISDLHEAPFAGQIIAHIRRAKPDIVAFGGDMVQLPDSSVDETIKIAEAVTEKYPDIKLYAVSGNHETQGGSYDKIIKKISEANIIPLDNDSVCINKGLDSILLIGVKDPKDDEVSDKKIEKMRAQIKSEFPDGPCFSVLLMHRADLYPEIKNSGADLILSGHLHGGIVRLPFIGGLIGKEDTGVLPKYEYGFIREGDSACMIVSGGCDMNPKKERFFNPPEVVLITLEREA